MKKIILASASPRRKALLKQIGLEFIVDVSGYQEEINKDINSEELVKILSEKKALNVSQKYTDAIIIAADTIIVFDNKIIGKPKDEKDAKKILKMLSGKYHYVITGFTIIDSSSKKMITKSEKTKVYMKQLTEKEINAYVATKEPLDKAGAYGIQELGAVLIEKIEGDYFNVVGLPIKKVAEELINFGIYIL